jgi:hypothetical protein
MKRDIHFTLLPSNEHARPQAQQENMFRTFLFTMLSLITDTNDSHRYAMPVLRLAIDYLLRETVGARSSMILRRTDNPLLG